MDSNNYLKDISEIKNMMNKSSRFISLSGLSGILAGIYALVGAAIAYYLVSNSVRGYLILDGTIYRICLAILFGVATLSTLTAIYLSTKKAKKNG
ncbi:MAG: putative lysophospholipase L1 biosynthesis ABC-type transport system permease subunit, partial [Psychroserpens sp.]